MAREAVQGRRERTGHGWAWTGGGNGSHDVSSGRVGGRFNDHHGRGDAKKRAPDRTCELGCEGLQPHYSSAQAHQPSCIDDGFVSATLDAA